MHLLYSAFKFLLPKNYEKMQNPRMILSRLDTHFMNQMRRDNISKPYTPFRNYTLSFEHKSFQYCCVS